MDEKIIRTAMLLKASHVETDLGMYGHHSSGCTIDPNCKEDQKFIRQAEEFLSLNIDLL